LYSGSKKYGENLAMGTHITPSEGVADWYNEIGNYDWNIPGTEAKIDKSKPIGHFTQLVWKGTTHVGCAFVDNCSKTQYKNYLVCNYRPAGNINGGNNGNEYYKANVLRAQ
jgi:hypothetical protein